MGLTWVSLHSGDGLLRKADSSRKCVEVEIERDDVRNLAITNVILVFAQIEFRQMLRLSDESASNVSILITTDTPTGSLLHFFACLRLLELFAAEGIDKEVETLLGRRQFLVYAAHLDERIRRAAA